MTPRPPVPDVIERVTGRSGWRAAVVLGSGLGYLAEDLLGPESIPYTEIEGMPTPSVKGQSHALFAGDVGGTPTLVFSGRVHLYEGHSPDTVTYAVRAAIGAGCDVVVLKNAAGGINTALEVGAPCLISDHLNLTGSTPLLGPNDETVGPRFPDLSEAYDRDLRDLARKVDPDLQEGVYAGMLGPAYETPAEIRMLATLGADMVGMSTVIETIAARHLAARVLGISVISNHAAGIGDAPLSHDEVVKAGKRSRHRLTALLRGVLTGLAEDPASL